ncbi:MAG: hypothetical protein IPM24_08850 [Bryobacterales bacterium]|nr:hypothetical protein [Bryobacterales bacterium]
MAAIARKTVAALVLLTMLPFANLALLAASTRSGMACCRTKKTCCCRKAGNAQGPAAVGVSQGCPRTCSLALPAGDALRALSSPAPTAGSPLAAVLLRQATQEHSLQHASLPLELWQRPPPRV